MLNFFYENMNISDYSNVYLTNAVPWDAPYTPECINTGSWLFGPINLYVARFLTKTCSKVMFLSTKNLVCSSTNVTCAQSESICIIT